jgi:transcriptional regulator with XRE-family HTH domain
MGENVYTEIRKKIGKNFKKQREKQKLSLRQVEAITGIGFSWISKFEKGMVNFEIDTLVKLASGVNVYLRDLCDFTHSFVDE